MGQLGALDHEEQRRVNLHYLSTLDTLEFDCARVR